MKKDLGLYLIAFGSLSFAVYMGYRAGQEYALTNGQKKKQLEQWADSHSLAWPAGVLDEMTAAELSDIYEYITQYLEPELPAGDELFNRIQAINMKYNLFHG